MSTGADFQTKVHRGLDRAFRQADGIVASPAQD